MIPRRDYKYYNTPPKPRLEHLAKYLECLYWETGVELNSETEQVLMAIDLSEAKQKIKSVKMCADGIQKYIPPERMK